MIVLPTCVFLDRDGTIIRDVSYPSRAADVQLLPGAAEAIRRLNAAAIPVIVVTNQSGIARGMFSVSEYLETESRLDALLAERDAAVKATYYCPHHPEFTGPCPCRKPGTLLFERAVSEHSLDMTRAVFIGDRWRDVAPAKVFRGTAMLISGPSTPPQDVARAKTEGAAVVCSLERAVDLLLRSAGTPE